MITARYATTKPYEEKFFMRIGTIFGFVFWLHLIIQKVIPLLLQLIRKLQNTILVLVSLTIGDLRSSKAWIRLSL